MRDYINYLKGDYKRIKGNLELILGKKLPNWLVIIYYVIVGTLAVPVRLMFRIVIKIKFWYIMRQIKKLYKI